LVLQDSKFRLLCRLLIPSGLQPNVPDKKKKQRRDVAVEVDVAVPVEVEVVAVRQKKMGKPRVEVVRRAHVVGRDVVTNKNAVPVLRVAATASPQMKRMVLLVVNVGLVVVAEVVVAAKTPKRRGVAKLVVVAKTPKRRGVEMDNVQVLVQNRTLCPPLIPPLKNG